MRCRYNEQKKLMPLDNEYILEPVSLREMLKEDTERLVEKYLEYDKKDNGSVSSYQCKHDIFWLMGIICTKKYDEFGQSKSIVPNADDLKYAQQIKTEAVLQLFQKKI